MREHPARSKVASEARKRSEQARRGREKRTDRDAVSHEAIRELRVEREQDGVQAVSGWELEEAQNEWSRKIPGGRGGDVDGMVGGVGKKGRTAPGGVLAAGGNGDGQATNKRGRVGGRKGRTGHSDLVGVVNAAQSSPSLDLQLGLAEKDGTERMCTGNAPTAQE